MRFLVDECRGRELPNGCVARAMRPSLFDDARGLEDDEVIRKAYAESWILITNDKDFGGSTGKRRPHGVILMRFEDERAANKIEVLRRSLEGYADRLVDSFVVVTDMHVRFAQVQVPSSSSST